MSEAKQGDTVQVHYTGRLGDGQVFDSSLERDPLEFKIGANAVIPGFEQAIAGMAPGQSKTITLEPGDAYGQYRDEMVHRVSRTDIPDNMELQPGMMVQAQSPNQEVIVLTVKDVDDDSVTLDANHPLAGKELTFDIELVAIV